MKQFIYPALFFVITFFAVLPLVGIVGGFGGVLADPVVVASLNAFAWISAMALLLNRHMLWRGVQESSFQFGIDGRYLSLETVLDRLLHEITRKNNALLINLVERRINSKEELSRTFEEIVALSFRLLDADSAELSLFDRDSGLYHSAFVLGKPFRSGAQAMLSGAVERDNNEEAASPDVLIQPIAFAGTVLGTLRVALKRSRLPSEADREILRILALESSIAMVNMQYNQELLRLKQASDESVKAKTGFLANLSHEIRGPLGIILNAVELVLDGLCGDISPDQRETLGMIHSNGDHLLELINDVLDYAKVESGRVQPNRTDIVIADLLQDLVQVVRAQAEAKHHKIVYKPHDDALGITCDRRHSRQMLINLLTNAIKYTPEGGTIELWAERAPGNRVRLNVRDSGIGIEESDRSKVFTAFERVENAYSMKQVGTGLGMPLTRRLAEMNGGSVDFQSSPGKGSHFWLLFPSTEIKKETVVTAQEPRQVAQGSGEIVLVVAPNDGERGMVERYLRHIGFQPVLTGDEKEALSIIEHEKVRLCIFDSNAVDDFGDNFVTMIRHKAGSSSLPIILLSSRAFVFDIEKYLRTGVDRCLIKPAELKELGVICRSLIDENGRGSAEAQRDAKKRTQEPLTMVKSKDLFH